MDLENPKEIVSTATVTESDTAVSDKGSLPVLSSEENVKHEDDGAEDINAGSISSSASGINEKSLPEPNLAKSAAPSGRKKRKELFKKLDSSGPTSDLYLASKGPEEKKESVTTAEIMENASSSNLEPISTDSTDVSQNVLSKENAGQSKVEPGDWEDAADITTPKLETSDIGKQVNGSDEDGSGAMTKNYSRDFLLKFAEQCIDLPEGFEFAANVVDALIASNVSVSRDSYASSGRIVNRTNMAARLDRRGSGLGEEGKWNKLPGPLMSGRDMRIDISYAPNMATYRPSPDAIDLRKNKWEQRRKVEGPKKIEGVHRDTAQERQAQSRGLARAPSMGSSVRRDQPIEFSPRGTNTLASPSPQSGGFRAIPPQLRGCVAQDVRMGGRDTFENRKLSILPQRPLGDDSITLGPQRRLALGMSFRGQSASPGTQLLDIPGTGDSRRVGPRLNAFSVADWTVFASSNDPMQRYTQDRLGGASSYDQSSTQEGNMAYGNRDVRSADRGFDRSFPVFPLRRGGSGALPQNVTSEKAWSEERLRDMSISTIKEFYRLELDVEEWKLLIDKPITDSARDENEVVLCIMDLNNPSFYPSMISLWVTDSFERKDMQRDLLSKLLITLTKYHGIISQDQLIKGFDSVLMTLEDAVIDAPRAAEFLGHIFAKVIVENVIPFNDIGRLIYEGGEEQGHLVEIGLAAEVLGTILEIIASERGDSELDMIRSSTILKLENFRPPSSSKTWRLEKFI